MKCSVSSKPRSLHFVILAINSPDIATATWHITIATDQELTVSNTTATVNRNTTHRGKL